MKVDDSEHLPVPDWLKFRGHTFSKKFSLVRSIVDQSKIATVCEEAKCPNRTECWSGGTATFMLMGDTCTRGCRFCSIKRSNNPQKLDEKEPYNLVESLGHWDLNYIVLTSVDRDDLEDGGSNHLAGCIRYINEKYPDIRVEILIPDFKGNVSDIKRIVNAKPVVIAHNIETVRRLTPQVRDRRATYDQSLHVLKTIKKLDPNIYTKSSIMLGLSEKKSEVIEVMEDLLNVKVDFLTLGQYMQPTLKQLPVKKYLTPKEFKDFKIIGLDLGFKYVASDPLIRSSYRAGEFFP